jgi:hypothetical protein
MKLHIIQTALAAACVVALAAAVQAEYLPAANANAVKSLQSGLGEKPLPLFRRRARTTAEGELSLLVAAVRESSGGRISTSSEAGRLRATSQSWQLDVFGDGSGAEFLNLSANRRAHSSGVRPSRAMSGERLEAAGRDYISRRLSKIVVLAPGERLVPVARSRRVESGVAADGSSLVQSVVANRIVFTREIAGVPVVGAGSKVTITFLNDGTVESLRYDWPSYERTGNVQPLAGVRDILLRVQRVSNVRIAGAPAEAPAPQAAPEASIMRPVELGGGAQLERLDCGYYDPGFQSRDAKAPIQAGCYYHVIHRQGTGDYVTVAAYSGAVPAAKAALPDPRWPENVLLRGGGIRKIPAPPASGPATNVQAVPTRAPRRQQ